MLQIGTLKSFNSTDYRAEVQLAGSIAAYLDNIPVARNIASAQMIAGRHVILAIPGGNPKDACVIAVWDAAVGGGGGGGASTFLALTDTPSSYPKERFFPRINEAKNALEFVKGFEWGQAITPWQWELAFFDWTTAITGSGSIIDKTYGSFRIQTGATAGSTARGRGYMFGWIGWAAQEVEWYFVGYWRGSSTNGKCWMKIFGDDTAADPVVRCIGFRIDNAALKGIVHDGTTLTVVDLGVTLVAHEGHQWFIKFVPGDKVYWYMDGVLLGSSPAIPTTTQLSCTYPVIAVANGADNNNTEFHITRQGWIAKSTG